MWQSDYPSVYMFRDHTYRLLEGSILVSGDYSSGVTINVLTSQLEIETNHTFVMDNDRVQFKVHGTQEWMHHTWNIVRC